MRLMVQVKPWLNLTLVKVKPVFTCKIEVKIWVKPGLNQVKFRFEVKV